jgi:hypothetical protein
VVASLVNNFLVIPGEKMEDHVDNYYLVQMFRAAYDGRIPSIPDHVAQRRTWFLHASSIVEVDIC